MVLIIPFTITIQSCGHRSRSHEITAQQLEQQRLVQSGISLKVYNDAGEVDEGASKTHFIRITQEGNSKTVYVELTAPLQISNSYVELTFDPKVLQPTQMQCGSALMKNAPLVYMGSPEAGKVICAQVLIGAKKVKANGELFVVKLDPGVHVVRTVSDFNQNPNTDPIIVNCQIDPSISNKLVWSINLRGDANANQIFDFADFGSVGKYYKVNRTANPASEATDGSNNGVIDFADFGVIGANYNKGVGGINLYRGDTEDANNLIGTIATNSKVKGDLQLESNATSIDSNGFKKFWYIAPGAERFIKLALVDLQKIEFTTNKSILDTTKEPAVNIKPPLNVVASKGVYDNKISISWSPPVDSLEPDGYKVYRSSSLTGSFSCIEQVGQVISYKDIKVDSPSIYYYKIKSTKDTNESNFSNSDYGNRSPKLASPTNVTSSDNIYPEKIVVSWEAPDTGDHPSSYAIYRANEAAGSYTKLAIVYDTTFEDTKVLDSNTYYYRISSLFGSKESAQSIEECGSKKYVILPKDNWAMFGHDSIHSGRSSFIGTKSPAIKWIYKTGGAVLSAASIDAYGTLYFGCKDGNLYAVNSNGTTKWLFQTGGEVDSAPALGYDGTIYFGSSDHKFYAINPDKSVKWIFSTNGPIASSPVIDSDGTLLIGSTDRFLYAINPDGSLKWKYMTGSPIGTSASISGDGTIYFGVEHGGLIALNQDGSEKWRFQTDRFASTNDFTMGIFGSPAIGVDGTIYVTTRSKKLYAINPDGTLKWYNQEVDSLHSSPVIGTNGIIYVGADKFYAFNPDGSLYRKVPRDPREAFSPAIGADGTIYICYDGNSSFKGSVYALDKFCGVIWEYIVPLNKRMSSPTIGRDGTIYIGSEENSLMAIGPGSGFDGLSEPTNVKASKGAFRNQVQLTWSAPVSYPQPDGYYIYRSRSDLPSAVFQYVGQSNTLSFSDRYASIGMKYSYKVQSYKFASNFNDSSYSEADIGWCNGLYPPTNLEGTNGDFNNKIIITWNHSTQGDKPDGYRIYRTESLQSQYSLISTTGYANEWEDTAVSSSKFYYYRISSFRGQETDSVLSTPCIGFVKIDNSSWSFTGEYSSLRRSPVIGPSKLSLLWEYPTDGPIKGSPAITKDGSVFFGSDDGYLYAINYESAKLWRYQTNGPVETTPAISNDGIIYFGSCDKNFYALTSKSSVQWKYSTDGPIKSSPVIDEGTIYFGSDDSNLYALNTDGSLKWKYTTGGPITSTPVVGIDGTIIFGSYDKNIYGLTSSGKAKFVIPTDGEVHGSAAINSLGNFFIGSMDKNLYAFNYQGASLWTKTFENTIENSPAIGINDEVFLADSGQVLKELTAEGGNKGVYLVGYHASSPSVDAGNNVFISGDGKIQTVDFDSNYYSKYETYGPVYGTPAIGSDGNVYVGSTDCVLYAFGPGGGGEGLLPPNNFKASDGLYPSMVRLTWQLNTNGPKADGYYIYRAKSENGTYNLIGKSTTYIFEDTFPKKGVTYWYKIRSYREYCNDSPDSNKDSGYRK